jgi:hypothetical protein
VFAHPRLGSCVGADIIAMGTRAYIFTLIKFNYPALASSHAPCHATTFGTAAAAATKQSAAAA